ncbi:hypothetical protein CDAR_241861 [Caerostris darwini]|uniref:Uncharacterized protein n=1 Tax=Caerostris darwini TaxID=1538125 RepID=A0AAV4NRI5_9ARAC|nr:hypothetical protein CDAR_241861 [Caerostris darwini]
MLLVAALNYSFTLRINKHRLQSEYSSLDIPSEPEHKFLAFKVHATRSHLLETATRIRSRGHQQTTTTEWPAVNWVDCGERRNQHLKGKIGSLLGPWGSSLREDNRMLP